jgi:hypothetical protein
MTDERLRAFDEGRRAGRAEGLTEAAHQLEREANINQKLAELHRDDPDPTVWFEYADLHRRWADVMHDLAKTDNIHITTKQHPVLSDAMAASVKFIDPPGAPATHVGDVPSITYDTMAEWLGYMAKQLIQDQHIYRAIASGIQHLRSELEVEKQWKPVRISFKKELHNRMLAALFDALDPNKVPDMSTPDMQRAHVAAIHIKRLIADVRREAMEEAAQAAENEPEPEGNPPPELHGRSVKNIATASVRATKHNIAAAIRALASESNMNDLGQNTEEAPS